MKAFVISLVALFALCALVICNGLYIEKTTENLKICASDVKASGSEQALNALKSLWDEHKFAISISVPHKETDEFEKSLILLEQRISEGNSQEFFEACALTARAIEEIKTHGTASADNIF